MGADPFWYLLISSGVPLIALGGLYLSQRNERQKRHKAHLDAEKRHDERDSRMHAAIYGYTEGATRVPGIFEIVVGDGNGGSLSAIAKGARTAAERAVVVAGETAKTVNDHVLSDDERWEKVDNSLDALSKGQKDAEAREATIAQMAVEAATAVASTAVAAAGELHRSGS